jgi:hypothetical protein
MRAEPARAFRAPQGRAAHRRSALAQLRQGRTHEVAMIRRAALAMLLLAAALGFGLYKLAYEVQSLETELARTERAIQNEREATHVMQAEWSYLNEPSRLSALAKKHLNLTAAGGSRIKAMTELPEKSGPTHDATLVQGKTP